MKNKLLTDLQLVFWQSLITTLLYGLIVLTILGIGLIVKFVWNYPADANNLVKSERVVLVRDSNGLVHIIEIDPLMDAVAESETWFLPEGRRDRSVSRCGAIGRYQIMPLHARGFGYKIKDLYLPAVNKKIAYTLMGGYLKRYCGSVDKSLAAYNGGHRQARLKNSHRCRETRLYVIKTLKQYHRNLGK